MIARKIHIERAIPDDARFLAYYDRADDGDEGMDTEEWRKLLERQGDDVQVFVAKEVACMYGRVVLSLESEIRISRLYVGSTYRRSGIGSKLVEHALNAVAKQPTAVRDILTTVHIENEAAVRLFMKCGFTALDNVGQYSADLLLSRGTARAGVDEESLTKTS